MTHRLTGLVGMAFAFVVLFPLAVVHADATGGCKYVIDAGANGLFSEVKDYKPSLARFQAGNKTCPAQMAAMNSTAADFPTGACSGFVSCKPGQYQFAACEASGPSSCPPAEQCLGIQKTSANPEQLQFSKPVTNGQLVQANVSIKGKKQNMCFTYQTGATGGQSPGGTGATTKDTCAMADISADDCYVDTSEASVTIASYPGYENGGTGAGTAKAADHGN